MRKMAKFLGVWIALLMMAGSQGVLAQNKPTMKDYFIAMPDSLMPMLDPNARKDLVDIAESGMTSALDNDWGGRSRIKTLTHNYLMLIEDIADSVTVEMALLPRGKDTLICVVRTIPLPQKDSELTFFNSHWQEIKPRGDIAGACLSPTDVLYLRLLPDATNGVSIVAAKQQISNLSDPLGRPAVERQDSVIYTWNGSKFVRQR